MPWVRLDDRFPRHRKVELLSDRAFRLYVSALCWSSENLTEGRILARELPVVARLRGIKTAAAELEGAGLWDRVESGWEIHDYLEYNPDRARVQADRAANAARQQAFRERKKAERNAASNGVTEGPESHDGDTTATAMRHDGDTTAHRTNAEEHSSPQVNGFRNGVSNGTPSPTPSPSHSVLPSEVPHPPYPPSPKPSTDVVPASGRGEVQPLIEAMEARGMRVSWTFSAEQWLDLRDAVRRAGVGPLVEHAARAWQAAKTPPYSARYFLTGWTGLQAPTEYTGPRSVTGPPSAAKSYLAQMSAHADRLRQQHAGGTS